MHSTSKSLNLIEKCQIMPKLHLRKILQPTMFYQFKKIDQAVWSLSMCRLIILNINIKVNYIINLLLIFNLISEDGSKDRLTDVLSIQTEPKTQKRPDN